MAESLISQRRRLSLVQQRAIRTAERELRRSQTHLTAFVVRWADGAFDRTLSIRAFEDERNRLVARYHEARLRVLALSGA